MWTSSLDRSRESILVLIDALAFLVAAFIGLSIVKKQRPLESGICH